MILKAINELKWNDLFQCVGMPAMTPDFSNTLSAHVTTLANKWIEVAEVFVCEAQENGGKGNNSSTSIVGFSPADIEVNCLLFDVYLME